MTNHQIIVEAAIGLARSLPATTALTAASAILTTDKSTLRSEISKRVPHHHHRDLVLGFISRWQAEAPTLEAMVVGIALETAAKSEQAHRDSQSVELVWTGPDSGDHPFRRTEQAILQLLDAAQERITLVSFAIYRIPNIQQALVRAAKRRVKISVIVETPDRLEGENEYSTLLALGEDVANCSKVYYWPAEKRSRSLGTKLGILHVKCAVADGEWLFLSSANLTEYAFTINMELGVLVTGGDLPKQVEENFDRLINNGQLSLV